MKRPLSISFFIFILFLSPSLMAMEPISEAEMDAVTGRRGVSIAADNQVVYQNIDFWYRDADGTTGTNGASIGFSGSHFIMCGNAVTQEIDPPNNPLSLDGHYVENYDYSNRGLSIADLLGIDDPPDVLTAVAFEARAIFIDVMDELPGLGEPGVKIAVPTLEQYFTTIKIPIAVNTAQNPLNANDSQLYSLGTVEMGPTTMTTLDGNIEISPGGDPNL